MLLAPEYSLAIQARIPAALATIHNFIMVHNPNDKPISDAYPNGASQQIFHETGSTEEAGSLINNEADKRRDHIAQEMWDDYRAHCAERGIGMNNWSDIDSEEEDDDEDGDDEEDDM